jgi:hypothetical protein
MDDMFEKATRQKLRFDTVRGQLTVEDLWDLPLSSRANQPNLDDIARALNKAIKNTGEDVSFVNPAASSDPSLQLRFDIVKHVIDTVLSENAARNERRQRAEKKERLLSIIAEREDESLKSMPLDELRKALEEL